MQRLKKLIKYFTAYEWIWFLSLSIASVVLAFVFPEDDVNGNSGILIMVFYVFDVVLAILCELLTSKQSKWSFIIYIVVEVIEITTLILLRARFVSMAISIFFWLPMHIISYINWNKHQDKQDSTLTEVRSLKWWQSALVVVGCIVWTVVVGYVTVLFGPETDFYASELIVKVIAYMDACVGAIGVVNGVLLYFRFTENWIVWYISIFLETAINIILGQWVMLVLKVGYLSNTTYGYLKWRNYIKSHQNKNDASDVGHIMRVLKKNKV